MVHIWVYNDQWFRNNKVYGSRSITGIRVLGSVLQSTCNIKQDYQSTIIYLEKVQNTCLVLAYYSALTSNHNRLTLQLSISLSYVLPLLLTYHKHLSIIYSWNSIQHILLSTLHLTQIRLTD